MTREEALTEAKEILEMVRLDLAGGRGNPPASFRLAKLLVAHDLLSEPKPEISRRHERPIMVFEILRELIDIGDFARIKRVIKKIRELEMANPEMSAEERMERAYATAYAAYYDTY